MRGIEERPEQAHRLRSVIAVLERELDETTAYNVMLEALRQFGFALPRSSLELRLFTRSALRQELLEHLPPRRLSVLLREIDKAISKPVSKPPAGSDRRATVREKWTP